MFPSNFPREIEREILCAVADCSFTPNAKVMKHVEIPVLARRISSFENTSARGNLASAYTQQRQSLATLCRVSRRFKDQLQPMLYTCIVIQSPARMLLLEKTLQMNPGIASLVKTIILMPWGWTFPRRVIQSIVYHCPRLEAYQDLSTHSYHEGVEGYIDLLTGIRLKKVSGRIPLVRQIFASATGQSILVSLELIGSETTSLVPPPTLPVLESLKIAIMDRTLYGCTLPSLRRLYIENGPNNSYIDKANLVSEVLPFFKSCGTNVTLLSFGQLNVFGGKLALDSTFPLVEHLLISTGRGASWFLPAWRVPLFDINLGHPKVKNIGLYGTVNLLESSYVATSKLDTWAGIDHDDLPSAIIKHFVSLKREHFPCLKRIHDDMEYYTEFALLNAQQGALWHRIKREWVDDGIFVDMQDFAID